MQPTSYKSGFFNSSLQVILENYDGVMNIILPTLGKERQKTYSPFLPICPETGHVLEIPVKEINKKRANLYLNESTEKKISISQLAAFEMLMQVKQRTNSK